jgi:hypothetical protein
MSTSTMDDAAKVLADPQAYADEPKLHAVLTHLRGHAPVSRVEVPNYRRFWAITKHADVMDIERNHTLFTNWPRPVLTPGRVTSCRLPRACARCPTWTSRSTGWYGQSGRIGSGPRRCER